MLWLRAVARALAASCRRPEVRPENAPADETLTISSVRTGRLRTADGFFCIIGRRTLVTPRATIVLKTTVAALFAIAASAPCLIYADDRDHRERGRREREKHHATRTPIKHIIVLIGENRTFDHIYGTYEAKHGQSVSNLLSNASSMPMARRPPPRSRPTIQDRHDRAGQVLHRHR
jgi:hypothetical protein